MNNVSDKLKVALILDNLEICKWQKDALDYAKDLIDIRVILNCQNTKIDRNLKKHFLYYLLNFLSLKNKKTIKEYFKPRNTIIENFYSDYELGWQIIPKKNLNVLKAENITVVIKFGMNLLKINDELSSFNIFSFHHGNPSKYRGRPAGFYEILNNEKKVGVIVQLLSNGIDKGDVYAFSEAQIFNYSYKKTAISFFSISRFMLRDAVLNFRTKSPIQLKKSGRNFKLPGNLLVIFFFLKIISNFTKRITYGLFFEKKWKVALSSEKINLSKETRLSAENFSALPINNKYNFYADPFFTNDGKYLRLEALKKFSGLGDLLEIDINNFKVQKVLFSGNHYSYPFSFCYDNEEYLLPEVASHSSPYFLNVSKGDGKKIYIRGLEEKRIVDTTLLNYRGYIYLFFGERRDAQNVLNLWISKSLRDNFSPHPSTPICINPSFARMGGSIIVEEGLLYRFGQNNENKYGEHINIMKILEISPQDYKEIPCGSISISGFMGPHTVNLNTNLKKIVLDYYEEKFSLFAGYRRLISKLLRK